MIRLIMPKGHNQLSLEGVTYNPDAEGAFLVPDHHAPELIRVHGGVRAPSLQDMEQRVDTLEGQHNTLFQQLEAVEDELDNARKILKAAQDAQAAKLAAQTPSAPSDTAPSSPPANPATTPRIQIATTTAPSG